jgi:hypothetical protein
MTQLLDVPGRGDCLPRDDVFGDAFPIYEEVYTVAPRSDWDALLTSHVGLESLVRKIKNQGQEGSCASNATAQCFEITWNMMLGPSCWIECSPISIYRWVAPGPGSGSTISGNLKQLRDVGLLPVASDANREVLRAVGLSDSHVLTPTGYHQPFPAGWQSTAVFFRAAEWYDISSFDGMVSAIFEGYPVCYGRAGHAICGVRVVKKDGKWAIRYANSWGNWGEDGYGYDSESYISGAIRSYGAWALRCPVLTDEFMALNAVEVGVL